MSDDFSSEIRRAVDAAEPIDPTAIVARGRRRARVRRGGFAVATLLIAGIAVVARPGGHPGSIHTVDQPEPTTAPIVLSSTTTSTSATVTSVPAASGPVPQYEAFISPAVAWVASVDPRVALARTTDGGAHWTDATPRDVKGSVIGLFALDARHAWLATQGSGCIPVVLRTVDGGVHWQSSAGFRSGSCDVQYFSFVNSTDGWVEDTEGGALGSEAATVLRTTDGGAHWLRMSYSGSVDQTSPGTPGAFDTGCDKLGLTFASSTRGFAAMACAGGVPALWSTNDAGRTWNLVHVPTPNGFPADSGYEMAPPKFFGDFGAAVVNGPVTFGAFLEVTHDRGVTWSAVSLPARGFAASVVDATHWWAATRTEVLTSRDGGAHWARVAAPGGGPIDQLYAVSVSTAWAITDTGSVRGIERTVDGGLTWSAVRIALS